jgi:haloacetate dehalogenase
VLRVNGIRVNTWCGGRGAPVLLLHGYPQSAIMWRKVAPALAEDYCVVAPDLRGYGDSDKPRHGYDKRTMAADMHALMTSLGWARYAVVGHDRGGRVAHRLALDHSAAVTKLSVLDIVPTHTVFRNTGEELAAAYWHWFYFQVPDLPEAMIGANPEVFLRHMFAALGSPGAIEEAAFQEYLRCFKLPGTIRATLEDYRQGATTDLVDDEADFDARVACPVLALWGQFGKMDRLFDVLATWRAKAHQVSGRPLPCGHFIPEEAPDELRDELRAFLS